MHLISNDKTVKNNTVQDKKDFNSQSLATQAKKGEQLVSLMPAIKKTFDLVGDCIVEIPKDNECLKNIYDEKWLEESKAKLLKQIYDETRAKLDLSRMEKQMKKQF